MNTGLLFYLAHRTSLCQKKIRAFISIYDITIASTKVCAKPADLNPAMAKLIANHSIVFAVSESQGCRPDCAAGLFQTLHIPLDEQGEPRGVLQLHGEHKTGYLIESLNQAIVVLPDIPEEIVQMLPTACEKLKQKFGLSGELPVETIIPYEELIQNAMNNK